MFTKIRLSPLAVFAVIGLAAQPSLANDELLKMFQDPNQRAMSCIFPILGGRSSSMPPMLKPAK